MGAIDEAAQVVGPTVEAGGREEIDAVVAPAEPAREFRDRHHLDQRDPRRGQFAAAARPRRRQVPSGVKVPTCIS